MEAIVVHASPAPNPLAIDTVAFLRRHAESLTVRSLSHALAAQPLDEDVGGEWVASADTLCTEVSEAVERHLPDFFQAYA
ncbi:MAG: hypothetical protein WD178_11295 [Actinomycetota bacterium]